MPDPADSEWRLTLDELTIGADGCRTAVDADDQAGVNDALSHFQAAVIHLTTVTNPASWYDTLTPLMEVCRSLGDYEKEAAYQAELDDLRKRFPALNG